MNEREDDELGILARRRIEAAVIAPICDEMRRAVGEEKTRDILRRAIRRAAIDAGAEMARRGSGEADLESFKAIWPLRTKDDALTPEVIDDKPGVFDSMSHAAVTPKAIAPWASATSATSYPATGTALSVRATIRGSN